MSNKRHKISPAASKKHFTKHASWTHRLNMPGLMPVMRGGIRF